MAPGAQSRAIISSTIAWRMGAIGRSGRAAQLVAGLEADEHHLAALGPEVDLVDVVDDDGKVRRPAVRQAEVGGVVAPGLDRDVEPDRRGQLGAQAPAASTTTGAAMRPLSVSTPATASPATATEATRQPCTRLGAVAPGQRP